MKKNWIILFILLVALILASSAYLLIKDRGKMELIKDGPIKDDIIDLFERDIYSCEEDRECIAVKNGCCGCGGGGEATTINENYSNYWNNKLSSQCEQISCTTVMSNHWTCFAEPKCINNKCELKAVE